MNAHAALSLLAWVLGLCVGSFLNVVIYRLPAGLSIAEPRWSFCPRCRATLRWMDNIPLLSWLALKARCRYCSAPISAQYPLVEAATGLAFVLAHHLLFVHGARVGLPNAALPGDAPLLAAWFVLCATMVVCAAMDLVSYAIFPSVTNFACAAAIVLLALWPRPEFVAERASSPAGAASVAALAASIVMMWLSSRREAGEGAPSAAEPDAQTPGSPAVGGSLLALAGVLVLAAMGVAFVVQVAVSGSATSAQSTLVVVSLLMLLAVMVGVGSQPRAADAEIHDAVEQESRESRGVALRELAWLTPIILAGVAAWLLTAREPGASAWSAVQSWTPGGGLRPAAGATFAMHGIVVGAGLGWLVRIVFTLAFGREAFGVGDIFILAAAGGAGGWDIAVLGFLLSVPIALVAWVLSLFLKSTVMIPFGPPLALGFMAALWLNRPAAEIGRQYALSVEIAWRERPDLIWMGGGFLLVGAALAVVLSRMLRSAMESGAGDESNRKSKTENRE